MDGIFQNKRFRATSFIFFIAATLLPSSALANTSITSNITTNTTWTTAGNVYIIENPISINPGVTLAINPGVIVKFRSALVGLTVNGTLNAQGTATSSIYFTSINDDIGGDTNGTTTPPAAGNWQRILVNSGGTATLKYAVVRYGGTTSFTNFYNNGGTLNFNNSTSSNASKYGLYHVNGNTNIATSTFNNNGNYGIYESAGSGTTTVQNSSFSNNSTSAGYFDLTSNFVLQNSGNTATGTGLRGLIVNGAMSKSQTWQADTIPYIVSAFGVSVPAGKTLTINPNAVVKFETTGSSLTVSGTLTVQQGVIPDIVNIVYFTSIKDDTIGGDTNGDGGVTTPAGGNWQRININSGGTATIEHAFIGYGGATYNTDIYNSGGTLNISTSTIAYGSTYGIYHTGGTTNVKQSVFRNNGSYGFYNTTTASTTATNNYWGDVSGPYNLKYNASGTGNPVSNYVLFNPWLGSSTAQYVHEGYAVNGTQLRFQWVATSTQDYISEWNNAVAKWNELDPINIVEATSTVDLTVEEYSDAGDPAVGDYRTETSPPSIRLNKAKLATRAFNQRQNAATHELGHALGLLHSYWENILYARNTFQTTFGPEDTAAYNYCWVDHTNCNF